MADWFPSAMLPWASFGAGAGGAFVAFKWLLEFVAGRVDKRQAHIDEGMQRLLDGLREEVERLKADCASLREGLDECRRKHSKSDAEVTRLKAMMQGYGDARQVAQIRLAADRGKSK